MAQNIYDNPDFFSAYSRLRRSTEGLDGAPEWPALRDLLPTLQGRRVLDLGCGFGWFCRWVRQNGAAFVTGLDVSENMLTRAGTMTDDPAITYVRSDMEQLTIEADAFDLVYSSLAFHYIAGLDRLLAQIYRALRQDGSLVFSVEHPIYTAPTDPGWTTNAAGRQTWPVESYLEEGPRSTDWLAAGVIKQHRTVATYINLMLRSGFMLTHVQEWGPDPAQIATMPTLATERERPPFLLLAARRPA
jgi:ubiquinone/menaquinone biosynthesis C-methylase UbiE